MSAGESRLADAAMRIAARLAPPHRADWFAAMANEAVHVPPAHRLRFSCGCLMAAIVERNHAMHAITLRPLEAAIMLGSAFVALLALANGARHMADAPAVGVGFLVIAALWSAVFIATMLMRHALLLRLAAGGTLAMIAFGLATFAPVPALDGQTALFRALSIEGTILFAALYAAAWFGAKWRSEPLIA